ncbi:hypothetical protein GGI20_000199 [Coemansia sp. BCRC 34301]|nr:hypothetical protein GGI20_000199 [Coemansia sp. BCRC 34301]
MGGTYKSSGAIDEIERDACSKQPPNSEVGRAQASPKKIRRKRQRSLFSMTAADEFSMLASSGRTGASAFDPMHLSSSRPRLASFQQGFDPASPREPPSLDMLAEMIKEEIRQASGLKQALDRVGFETQCMATRMSALSMDGNCSEAVRDYGSAKPGAKKRANGKIKKQVQFVVPDDVRFRWLGIFQQPAESEDVGDSESETPTPAQPPATDAAAINDAPATTIAMAAAVNTSPDHATSLSHSIQTDDFSISPRSSSILQSAVNRSSSMDDVDTSYVFLPFTANSSVEAVYGGSRSDTRESSMLGSGASMPNSARRARHHAHGSRSNEELLNDKVTQYRLDRLLKAGEPDYNKSAADDARGANGAGHRGKYSTISGKNSRRIAAQLQMSPHEHSDPSEPIHTRYNGPPEAPLANGRNGAVSPPPVSRRASVQPSLATSKVTVTQRHSVSPEFAVTQVVQPQNDGSKPSKVEGVPPLVFRSGSAHSEIGSGTQPGSSARRRNSLDESRISSRGALRADLGSGSADLLRASVAPSSPHRTQPAGLFRRVTTTAALRKHNQHAEYANSGDGDDMGGGGGGGIIGGTREFFKHRLRSRTHANGPQVPNGTSQNEIAHANGDAEQAERPRKRSDAEVKSRESSVSPPPLRQQPALPDHLQRIPAAGRRGAAAKHAKSNGVAGAHHALLPPRPPAPPSSSSSSGTQGDVFRTPLHREALHSQRKSHDGGTSTVRTVDEHAANGRVRARTASAESTRQHHQSSTVRVGRGQNDVATALLHLRPANGDVEDGAGVDHYGTRSRSRRNTSESASSAPPRMQPPPPRRFMLNVGRSGEQPTSAHDDSDEVVDPPPVPKLPAGSPPPPHMSSIASPQEAAKAMAGLADKRQHPAGDVDSIDYHLRRLRSGNNNKGRRSSFMTTISNMLGGRKE